jgi:hypothetical protein
MNLYNLKTNNIYKLYLIFYLLSLKYFAIEVSYIVSLVLFLVLLLKANKFNKLILFIVFGLLMIVIIGIVSSLFSHPITRDFIKDLVYFSKPILVIINVYKLISLIKNKNFLVKLTVYLGTFSAIFHFFALTYYVPKIGFQLETLRHTIIGQGNILEGLAFVFLLVKDKNSKIYVAIKYKIFLMLLLITSILLYFSRTDLVVLLILSIGIKGFIRPKKKTFYFITAILIASSTFLYSLSFLNLKNNDGSGVKMFLHKIQNSSNEIFSNSIKRSDTYAIHSNWRAYEANAAINQINDGKKINKTIGEGFGALVNLKLKINLGGEDFRYIPMLHNGYAYLYFKTGLIGLIIYVSIFLITFIFGFIKKTNDMIVIHLITSVSLTIMFTSLVITGIYGASDLLLVYLISMIAIYNNTLSNKYE